MASPEFDSTPGPVPAGENATPPCSEASRPGLSAWIWQGASLGFRWVSLFAGTLCAVAVTLGLALTMLGLGAGRGWGVPPLLPPVFLLFFASVTCGVITGAFLGLVGGAISRAVAGTRLNSWWSSTRLAIRRARNLTSGATPAGGPRPRRRRWRWLVGALLVITMAAGLGTGAYLGRVVDHRLAAAIAAADRDDPDWRLDDLMAHREVVPEGENSAPVVAKVLSLLPAKWPEPEVVKTLSRLSANAENVRLEATLAAVLRRESDKCLEAIKIGRTIAGYRRGRHEVKLGPALIDTSLPETQAAGTAARLLTIDAVVRADGGDADGSLATCRAILGVARSIGDEPFVISQQVRVAIGDVALSSAVRTLAQGEASDTALAQLQSLILDELAKPLLLYGIKGERAAMTELIRRVGAGEVPISALSGSSPKLNSNRPRIAIAPWGKLNFANQRALALTWFNEAVAIARRPPPERSAHWALWHAEINKLNRSPVARYTAALAILLTPSMSHIDAAHSQYLAKLGATAILVAAERHRRNAGNWPATIAAIDPKLLSNVPLDPFSGKPFHMAHREGQFLIYSVGPNREDDNGQSVPNERFKISFDDVSVRGWDIARRRAAPGLAPDSGAREHD